METKDVHEYAWNWFEYHAGQRHAVFRFFLVFLGVLLVAFSTGLKDGNIFFASVVGWFGAFISFVFLILEFRNEQLVNVGRDALEYLEKSDEALKAETKLKLIHLTRNSSPWVSYKYWLKAIYVLCMVLFVIAAFNPTIVLPAG
ncbi:MAG: hypothetical protein ACRD8U_02220 [Pyrinomonadaceae bacterium]